VNHTVRKRVGDCVEVSTIYDLRFSE
jgi:hypothetical protein